MPGSFKDRFSWLNHVLSEQRLGKYRRFAGDEKRALDLYLWNMEISAGFMVPLHVFEVSLRNAVAEAIAASHGKDWGLYTMMPKKNHPLRRAAT